MKSLVEAVVELLLAQLLVYGILSVMLLNIQYVSNQGLRCRLMRGRPLSSRWVIGVIASV